MSLALVLSALAFGAPAAVASDEPPVPEPLGARYLHLTFDDGPSPRWTPQVLDVLRHYRARATFFAVGSALAANPALARRIVREGHTLENHTWSHADLTRLSATRFASEVDRTSALVRRLTGRPTRLLRPPYGAVNAAVQARAASRGHRIALWDVDPQDWRRPGVSTIVANVLARARPGGIVLLHDGGGDRSQTVAALGQVLETLTRRGYRFNTMAE